MKKLLLAFTAASALTSVSDMDVEIAIAQAPAIASLGIRSTTPREFYEYPEIGQICMQVKAECAVCWCEYDDQGRYGWFCEEDEHAENCERVC